jgi:hypothetical protein
MNSNFKSDRLLLVLSAPVLLGWLFLMPGLLPARRRRERRVIARRSLLCTTASGP